MGQTLLITGATSGIGFEAAHRLAAMGHEVILVGRNEEKLSRAVAKIKEHAGHQQVHGFCADLSQMREVRRLSERVCREVKKLDGLLNNAGALYGARQETPEGIENTFALNHLAPFLLSHLLLPLLQQSSDGRIVTVASEAHWSGYPDPDDWQQKYRYSAWQAYAQSKLCNILFTYEWARRYTHIPVTCHCYHPGMIRSGFGTTSTFFWQCVMRLAAPLMRTPAEGADTGVWLMSDPEPRHEQGLYYYDHKQRCSSLKSHDRRLAGSLWQYSEELCAIHSYA